MHDPKTVAHEIKIGKTWLITIWHVDPETDGTDDSCGWPWPRVGEADERIIDEIVNWEIKFPYLMTPYLPVTIASPKYNYHQMLAGDCIAYIVTAWMQIAWKRDRRRKITFGEFEHILNLATNPYDNLRAVLASPDSPPEYNTRRFLYAVMRQYLGYHRPWWRHPRWHIYHWEFQIHPVQKLKRFLFSRCAGCGKMFRWGYVPTSTQWEGTGPLWFRREQNVYHRDCLPVRERVKSTAGNDN